MVKERITFQLDSLDSIDTDNIVFTPEELTIPGSIYQKRQDRITLELNELPQDIQDTLKNIYQFRLQWSPIGSKSNLLFQNYHQDGFSVYIVPSILAYEPAYDELGLLIEKSFDIHLNHTNVISTATSATFHTFSEVKTSNIQKFLRRLIGNIEDISSIEDFDVQWEDKKLKIQWISSPHDSIIKHEAGHRKEIALLQVKDLSFDLELSGLRTVLDDSDYVEPSKTLIFVKPRHQSLNEKLNFELSQPVGLHPTLEIHNLNLSTTPNSKCELFIHSTIPNSLIFDKYQYDEKSLKLLSSWGENDLEAPLWNISPFGSAQLFQVVDTSKDHLEIKYHSRYIKPSFTNTSKLLTPQVFWACDSKEFVEDYEQVEYNPFDSLGLGYASFFEPSTIFHHYENDKGAIEFEIPTADAANFTNIQIVTLSAVTLGTLYILRKILGSFGSNSTAIKEKKTK